LLLRRFCHWQKIRYGTRTCHMYTSGKSNEGGYRDGLKHEKERNKWSPHCQDTQSYMASSLYLCFCLSINRTGMVSCSFACLSSVMTHCFFLFHVSSHPYIPLHFGEMIFHLFPLIFIRTTLTTRHW
jgi:hypothetical protein